MRRGSATGLGTVLTTRHTFAEDEGKALPGLPADVTTYALLPIGYPQDGNLLDGVRKTL